MSRDVYCRNSGCTNSPAAQIVPPIYSASLIKRPPETQDVTSTKKSWRVGENLGTSGISVDTMKVAALKLSPTCNKSCLVEAELVLTSSGMCSGSWF